MQSCTFGNGLTEANTFTLDLEVNQLRLSDGATALINRAHTRTDALNLTNITDAVTAANNQSYWQNAANRLQNADGSWGAKTFYYDGVGNRTQETSTVSAVTTTDTLGYPSNSNRLVQITRGATTTRTLVYDNAGNLTSDTSAGGAKTYAYNNRNRMSTATVGALAWAYTYNGMEQLAIRTQTAGGTGITHFIHDPFGNVIAETAGGGATGATGTVREYIYLPEAEIAPTFASRTRVDRPVAVVDGVNGATPVTYYVHVDHLNRPIRMTNAAKASVWDATWLPWGGSHAITGTASLNARFPGQWFQSESGLHYNWHRQYDPSIGRYTQPDPLGFVDGPSVYGYATGRPQMAVDLDGRNVAGGVAVGTVILARYCLKNPDKCRKELLCPAMRRAKDVICTQSPGCKTSRSAGALAEWDAGLRMRAGEGCLALRDAEAKFCPLLGTTDHVQARADTERKIERCQQQCGWERKYPF